MYNRQPWLTKYGEWVNKERFIFLGVLTATATHENIGETIPEADQRPQKVVIEEMIDLGIVLKADCVLETITSIP